MKKNIFLFSDQAIHWNIVPTGKRKNVYWESWGSQSTIHFLDYLKSYFNRNGLSIDWSSISPETGHEIRENPNPTDSSINHAFATWRPYNEGKNKVWRIQEIVHVGEFKPPLIDESISSLMKSTDLFIFQDWGMDIRNIEIPELVELVRDKWVIYRSYPPLFEGNLWKQVQQGNGSKNVILLRADYLRELNTSISKGLSWEQTIQDITNEIYFKRNILLHPLRTIEYVIISFGCTGTLLIHNFIDDKEKKPDIKFFFDAMGIEGYWEKAHPGYLPGDLELLAALLAKEIIFTGIADEIQMDRAIRAHLLARRTLLSVGANVSEGSLALDSINTDLEKIYGAKKTHEFSPVDLDYSLFQTIY